MGQLRVVVLGGYGNFGKIIAKYLSEIATIDLVIAGRSLAKASAFAAELNCQFTVLDAQQTDLADKLVALAIDLVISTAGPFQGQNYKVAEAAIAAHAHYIDLADGRDFVCGIQQLGQLAKENNVIVCSGASSVPGLSSAVINELLPRFSQLRKIAIGISTSEKTPGKATIEGMLGYCGKPINQWIEGKWQKRYGWQHLLFHQFAIGKRPLAAADVPDLSLFPEYYKGIDTVIFNAGTGLKLTHYGTWLFAWLIRLKLIRKPQQWAGFLHKNALKLERFGNGESAIYIEMTGLDREQRPLKLCWELVAKDNDGVHIPTLASIALTKKIVQGRLTVRGAMSSMGLLTLDEYLAELTKLNIETNLVELYPLS